MSLKYTEMAILPLLTPLCLYRPNQTKRVIVYPLASTLLSSQIARILINNNIPSNEFCLIYLSYSFRSNQFSKGRH